MRKGMAGKGKANVVSTKFGDSCQLHVMLPKRLYDDLFKMAKESDAIVAELVRNSIQTMVAEYKVSKQQFK